jgi:hypothetical protein
MRFRRIIALLAVAAGASLAQPKPAPDEEFAKLVKEWTTRPEFMTPVVDHLPKLAGIPSPKDVLGYYIGAPKKLTNTEGLVKYYRALAAATPRVKVFDAGKTDEGRDCLVAAVADEETMRHLDTYKQYLAKLADPRGLSDAEAKRIIGLAKPIYLFSVGLHSAETSPPEMLMELIYRLATEDSPLIEGIRKNVIVMTFAVSEPDGRDRYVDWYYKYKTSEETDADNVGGPPYWGKYIFHDNNRDINYSQVTMRNWLKFYLEWHPPIMHDLHESQPFLYTFSGQPPQNPTLDPILYAEMPWFSEYELTRMIAWGVPGVWTHAFVDMWSPGYLGFMSSNHNGMLRMYEIMGNGGANTMRRNVAGGGRGAGGGGGEAGGGGGEAGGAAPGGEATAAAGPGGVAGAAAAGRGGRGGGRGGMTSREWYRPVPPYPTVDWSMRNSINYSESAVLAALELTSKFPQTVLENFYLKSLHSIESGKTSAPYGYVLPGGQRDMTRVAFIVDILRTQGIEVGRSTGEVKLNEGTFPAGSLIVKRDQPYGRLAKILLEKQNYPDPALNTYDDAAWTMGLMSHAQVKEIADKRVLDVPVQPVGDKLVINGEVKGSGPITVVLHNGSNSIITLRYRLKDLKFEATEQPSKSGDTAIPAGSLIVASSPRVKSEIEKLGLQAVAIAAAPEGPRHEVDLPRLALYSTWSSTQDAGWVRYALDHFEVPYDLIYKDQVKQGNLHSRYDVVVIPAAGRGSGKSLVFESEPRAKPLAYVKSADFKTLGMYGETQDTAGGMGLPGVGEFDKFVNDGGVLITMGSSSFFPADFALTHLVDAARPTAAFYAPGPIVEMNVSRPTHPIFYGYTDRTMPVRWAGGPLLSVGGAGRGWALASFPGGDESVLSGLMRGANEIRGRAAVIDAPQGKGHVVLFSTNPAYRWQNLGEFNMLANAILNFNDYPAPPVMPAGGRGGRGGQ